jgi:hypothetical protein
MRKVSLPENGMRLELYRRSIVPSVARERQTATVERLRALNATERIEAVTMHSWEKQISIEENQHKEGETHHVYAAFEDWAHEYGVNLSPSFQTRECYSSITGESHTAVVLPILCLAVSTGNRLHAVFPHADEGETHSVGDALNTLETNDSRY